MVRFAVMGMALVFSFLSAASADILPRPERRTQEPARCACFRAPCDCERYERDLDRQSNRPVAYSQCVGADFQKMAIGTREICTYTDVSCFESKSSSRREYTEVTLNAYCARPVGGECPRPRDLTDCVNSDDVSQRDIEKIEKVLKQTCEPETQAASATRPPAPARRTQ